jgi:hypothetical protein
VSVSKVDTVSTFPDQRTLHPMGMKIGQRMENVLDIKVSQSILFGATNDGLHLCLVLLIVGRCPA